MKIRGENIKRTVAHDEVAHSCCSHCSRYPDNPECLDHPFWCECGKKNGFSGSFKKPNKRSKWS